MGISSRPGDNPNHVYVTYLENNSQVGKVLFYSGIDADVPELKVFEFMSSGTPLRSLQLFNQHSDYIIYGGSTNQLIDSSSGFGTLEVDWKESDKTFGFISCSNIPQREKFAIQSDFDGTVLAQKSWREIPDEVWITEYRRIRQPKALV